MPERILTAITNLQATEAARYYGNLPDGMVLLAADWTGLNLVGATALKRLPEDVSLNGQYVRIEGAIITGRAVVLDEQMPETVLPQVVGRRLGEVVRHRLLEGHSHSGAVIVEAFTTWDGRTVLALDRIFGVADEDDRRKAEKSLRDMREATGEEPF